MNKLAHLLGVHGAASLAALGLLASCVSSVATLDPETQAACIREAGITGSYSVTTTQFDDRITYVVGPGPGVRQAQTDIANACIARKVSGNGVVAAGTTPVSGSCTKRSNPLQGGVGYC